MAAVAAIVAFSLTATSAAFGYSWLYQGWMGPSSGTIATYLGLPNSGVGWWDRMSVSSINGYENVMRIHRSGGSWDHQYLSAYGVTDLEIGSFTGGTWSNAGCQDTGGATVWVNCHVDTVP